MVSEYCKRSHNHWGDHSWSAMGYGDRVCDNCGEVEYSESDEDFNRRIWGAKEEKEQKEQNGND